VQGGGGGGSLREDEAVEEVPALPKGADESTPGQFFQHQRAGVDGGGGRVHNVALIQRHELLAVRTVFDPVSYCTTGRGFQEERDG
jgi:hypothetical protein